MEPLGPQAAQDLEAVDAGQADVEDDEVRAPRAVANSSPSSPERATATW